MSDYDFKQLNDKEFEVFCADILGTALGFRIERFKPGKDFGIDGRYFSSSGSEVLLQCKHWSNTPNSQLISMLEKIEKLKLDKLKPQRYLLAVSNPLSRADKRKIFQALSPYIISESEIYGKEDLNDLLKNHPEVEGRHYKLWLHSTAVLGLIFNSALIGRSSHSLQEIINTSRMYAITSNHESALKILEKFGVVIISGEPGVGKTTLANHLCLKYVADGFDYYKISDEIREAESIFNANVKQIFYFDDFLGRNYLEALKGHEGNQVTQFIKRVSSNKNTRFVLTSRSTILNQGKFLIDNFEHDNLRKNEFELKITSLSQMDKAEILYNHIFHSGMNSAYIEQMYLDKRYRVIINHRNFNPRLINYITDPIRLESHPADSYWQYVLSSLTNPSQIWDNPFSAQLDDFGRVLVLLVVLHGHAIQDNELSAAYQRYVSLPSHQSLKGKREYLTNLRLLTGSFLNRTISNSNMPLIDLFNPSIGDYVLRRYSSDISTIKVSLLCLRTTMSLFTLESLKRGKYISNIQAQSVCEELLKTAYSENFFGFSISYISTLIRNYIEFSNDLDCCGTTSIFSAIRQVIAAGYGEASEDSFVSLRLAIKIDAVTDDEVVAFVKSHHSIASSESEITAVSELLKSVAISTNGFDSAVEMVKSHVYSLVLGNFSDYIEADEAFSKAEYRDQRSAETELVKLLEKKFDELGIDFDYNELSEIISNYDLAYEFDQYYENLYDGDDRNIDGPRVLAIDEIDDLFERG